MRNELVSIISPCYNVAPYIGRFLDSLISQTYKSLEIILVNDGATDSTGDIIQSYIPRLENEGYKVIYLEQENGGQSSAINHALKHVTGQYLTWPDPDDWLTPDSIEKRVDFLEKHRDVGLVRCNAELVDEETEDSLGLFEEDLTDSKEINHFFEKLVYVKTWYGAMCCMVRMECLDKVIPNREIYVEKKGGQNWQLMLPIAQKYSCWQMPDVLAFYLVRKDSHSHSADSSEKMIAYSETSERVLSSTLSQIDAPAHIIASVHEKYAIQRFEISWARQSLVKRFSYYKKAIKQVDRTIQKIVLTTKVITPYTLYYLLQKLHLLVKK